VSGVAAGGGQRHLVRSPGALHREPVDHLRTGPTLRCPQDDHWPLWTDGDAVLACGPLDLGDLVEDGVEGRGEKLVDGGGVVAGDEIRLVSVPGQQRGQLVVADAGQHRRVSDLVPVEVEDRQHRAVTDRVEELVRVPRRRQRAGLGLTVADDARDNELGVVQGGAVGVRQGVAKLAAFVDGPRRLRGHVGRDPAGE